MSYLTPNTKVAITLGSVVALGGSLLYAGWFANGLLRDIKEELGAMRSDIKAVASDRWTGRDMRDYSIELKELNSQVQRSEPPGRGLVLPDVRLIQQRNRSDN